MKKIVLSAMIAGTLFASCTKDDAREQQVDTDLTTQIDTWKSIEMNTAFIETQQQISHYQFEKSELQSMVSQKNVSYVWLDLGLNANKQITVTATGVNEANDNVLHVSSRIISSSDFKFNAELVPTGISLNKSSAQINPVAEKHLLNNNSTKSYIANYTSELNNFNEITTQGSDRVERFGVTLEAINAILECTENTGLSVFFGINPEGKMTTVLIGNKSNGILNLNNDPQSLCGRSSDFGKPCPVYCNNNIGG